MNKKYTIAIFHFSLKIFFTLIMTLFILTSQIFSQSGDQKIPPDPTAHDESIDGKYIPDLRDSQDRSPAYTFSSTSIFTKQVNVDANGLNIVGDAANEPSIAVDPTNPNSIVIGWRQFNTISSSFRQAGNGYTTNGGQTWTFPGVIEPGIFRSDPVLGADKYGNFYYNSLTTNPYYCDLFKSTDGGATWGAGVYAQGGDKQWMVIDKTNSTGSGHIYAYWTSSLSTCYPGFFTRSTNAGASFEDCITIPNDPSWGTLAVGRNGDLYVGGTDGFSFNFLVAKSTNAKISGQIVTWSSYTTVNLNGSISGWGGPNPGGLLGQTWIAVDTSGGPYDGYVYLLCSVEPTVGSDPLDIRFARSTNGGANWSSSIRVNDDPSTSAYQWFGTMSVAPNGRIDAIWLDTRDNPGSYNSALYYSYSTDAGVTWSQNEKLSDSFNPHVGWPQQEKMGDYFDMVSDNIGASLAWAATFNGEQDVYYSYIIPDIIPVELLSFSASVSTNVVNLNWSTATELNNRGFEIGRKSGQTDWQTIGFSEGKGTTTEPQHYIYSDILIDDIPNKFFYRLKQLDFDGSFEYSSIVEVIIPPSEFSLLQNYPNPFNPSTIIRYQMPINSHVTLKVYDVIGNEIATLVNEEKSAGEYRVDFDASKIGSGIYFYTLSAGEFLQTKKMILVK